jgi:hypothetical protein
VAAGLSLEDCHRLVNEAGTGLRTLPIAKYHIGMGSAFTGVPAATEAFRDSLVALRKCQKDIEGYLQFSSKCRLLQGSGIPITADVVIEIIDGSCAGPYALKHVRELGDGEQEFLGVAQLVEAVRQEHTQFLKGRRALASHLAKHKEELFTADRTMPDLLPHLEAITAVMGARGAEGAVRAMKAMVAKGQKCHTVEQLLASLPKFDHAEDPQRLLLLRYFNSTFHRNMHSELGPVRLAEKDAQMLLTTGKAGHLTINILHCFRQQGRTFESLEHVAKAIHDELLRYPASTLEIFRHLTDRRNMLWEESDRKGVLLAVTVEDVRLLESEAGAATMAYLDSFRRTGRMFRDPEALVKALVQASVKQQHLVYDYVRQHRNALLQGDSARGEVAPNFVRVMVNDSTAGPLSYGILARYVQLGRMFNTVEDLAKSMCNDCLHDDDKVIAFFSNDREQRIIPATLLSKERVVSLCEDVEVDAAHLLTCCFRVARTGHPVTELRDLIPQLREARGAIYSEKQEIMQMLRAGEEGVENLMMDTHASPSTSSHIRQLHLNNVDVGRSALDLINETKASHYKVLKLRHHALSYLLQPNCPVALDDATPESVARMFDRVGTGTLEYLKIFGHHLSANYQVKLTSSLTSLTTKIFDHRCPLE